jgi:FxsC-like protein
VRRSELGKFVRAAALPPPPQPSALETPAMASDRPSAIVRPAAPTPPPVQRTAPATRKWPAPRYWFYVSYAQTDADPYFRRFVEDLDGTIRRLVGHGEPTGFFGRSTAAPGASWTERVGDALASSRVLLAMVSPAFLHSDACGKEWQFFAERARHTGSQQPDILPVRWVRVHTVPKVISRREAWASGLPEAYREDGVQFLIRRSKYRDDYDALVHRLAQALIDAAGAAAIPVVMEPPRWETLTNAFQDQGAAAAPDPGRTVQFVFMVAGRAEMDPVRASLQTYGETAEDWTPYPQTLARDAATVAATAVDRVAEVSGDSFVVDELRHGQTMAVVVIDAWSLTVPAVRERAATLDTDPLTNCGFIVVFDAETDTKAELPRLQDLVGRTLPNVSKTTSRFRLVYSNSELITTLASTLTRLQLDMISSASAQAPPRANLPRLI